MGSYTGLCPSKTSLEERHKQSAVFKHGNSRVRHQLIEAVWWLNRWQPNQAPLKKLHATTGARSRKRAVVAVANRLAAELWRMHAFRRPAKKLGLVVAPAS